MTDSVTISVVIVSRHRPEALRRCLMAVSQLRYRPFEVVIVTDPAECAALEEFAPAANAKLVAFDEANVSAARNKGIAAAAGEIVAFIDDDAVPEPTWLCSLALPFADPEVAVAGGFVRGRNGISWQSRAQTVDRTGQTQALTVDLVRSTVLTPTADRAVKTEGTNMAVRRDVLVQLGGFDPAFRFFLDETDLNLRLAARGAKTAIVPRAEVHHGFAASQFRRRDRVPTDLSEIGASWAVFLRKHCTLALRPGAWSRARDGERRRVLGYMVNGALEPRDVTRLMRQLEQAYAAGQSRRLADLRPLTGENLPFRPYSDRNHGRSVLVSGRIWNRRRLGDEASRETAAGNVVTLMRLSRTALFHRVRYMPDGYWQQTGGIYGKSNRSQPLIAAWSLDGRVEAELDRVRAVRGFDELTCHKPDSS